MKNRKKMVSILAGVMAFIMLLSLVLSLLPTKAHAASSSEIRKQINQLKEEIDEGLKTYTNTILDHLDKMQDFRGKEVSREEKQDMVQLYLADVDEFQEKQETLYEKFQALSEKKAEKYDREYAKTVSQFPKWF